MTDGNETQSERFIKKAKELGCDEDEGRFQEMLKRIVKPAKPKAKRPAEG